MNQFSIYIHIPFCKSKCAYCDFLSFENSETLMRPYAEKLCEEIRQGSEVYKGLTPYSVFIGGGTPTLLPPDLIKKLLETINACFYIKAEAEYTVEANPETVTKEKLGLLLAYGANRLSMGVQSFDDSLLRRLGRIHSFVSAVDAYSLARTAGFENINLDLMFGLPGQSIELWDKTLKTASALKPEHLSCYSLMLEDGTKLAADPDLRLPHENDEREMYYNAKKLLAQYGYERYEISNFALSGRECKHNTVYWSLGDYIGFGLGAHSLANGTRYHNTGVMKEYLAGATHKELISLSDNDKYSEFMFLGLRMDRGVTESGFRSALGASMHALFGDTLTSLVSRGLLTDDGERVALTEKGIDLSNMVFSELLLD